MAIFIGHTPLKYFYCQRSHITRIFGYMCRYNVQSLNINLNIYRSFVSSFTHLVNVKVPTFPESISEATIHWVKNEGDSIQIDEVIGELETDKTTLQIIAPNEGIISKLFFKDGDKVIVTDIVCDITPQPLEPVPINQNNVDSKQVELNEIVIYTPTFPESITEGDIRWRKNVNDNVTMDEIIGEIETDKTTLEIVSPCDGIITELSFKNGDKAMANSKLASINKTAVSTSETPIRTSSKINQTDVPLEEKIVITDNKKPTINTTTQIDQTQVTVTDRTVTKVKMTRIRETISKRLKHAQNTCAMLTTFNEVDMSNIIELRKTYQDLFVKKHDIKLGFMSAFIKSSCYALQQIPIVNAYISDDEILYHNYIDISVAVASPKGLVVPVIRDVQSLDFSGIEKELVRFAQEAKSGKLKAEDMDGGTFTISNGGVFGSLMGTPIINPPQAAILGIHAINERPVVVNGNITIRPMMYLALTYDHRLIDGREAVTFLRKIKQCIEDPRIMILNL